MKGTGSASHRGASGVLSRIRRLGVATDEHQRRHTVPPPLVMRPRLRWEALDVGMEELSIVGRVRVALHHADGKVREGDGKGWKGMKGDGTG